MSKIGNLACLLFIIFSVSQYSPVSVYASIDDSSVDIVYIVDVSGSMEQSDRGRYVRDALRLGIDLAPAKSRIAIISVNYAVVSETSFMNAESYEGRSYLRAFVNRLHNQGNTNFIPGFERALEMLRYSSADHRRIIFLGDMDEGGFNVGTAAEAVEIIEHIAGFARDNEIVIDFIAWGEPPGNSLTAPRFFELPNTTEGNLFRLPGSNQTPSTVERLYFQEFEYDYSILSVFGEASQTIDVSMPIDAVRRVRVFVSSEDSPSVFGVNHAGADIHGEHNRTFAIADLLNPSANDVSITIAPGN